MKRTLNIKFLVGMLAASVVLGGAVYLVHSLQMSRNAGALLRRARAAESKGDLDQGEKYLLRYLTYRPDDDEALARYALVLDKQAVKSSSRNRRRVVELLDLALARAKEPNDALRREVRRRAAETAMTPELGRYKQAHQHLEKLLKLTPDDAALEELFGRCLEAEAQSGRPDEAGPRLREARGHFEKALKRDPSRVEAAEHLAGLLRRRFEQPEAADQVIDQMVAGDAKAPRPATGQADALLARARYRREYGLAGASDDVAEARRLAPNEADVLAASGEAARAKGDLGAARAAYRRGIELHPKDVRMHQGLAAAEVQAGRLEEARKALERGLEALPGGSMLRWNLAELLVQMGKGKEARAEVAQLRKQADVVPAAVDFLEARLLLAEGDRDQAVRRLEKAQALLASAPGTAALAAQANLLLAQVYERMGNPDRQLDAARRVVVLDPGSLEARLRQIAALRALGRTDQALEEYRKIDSDPELARRLPTSRLDEARLLLAANLRRPEKDRAAYWDEVDRVVGEAERALPGAVDVPLIRAEVLAARGRLEDAGAVLREARDKHPGKPAPWIALANLAGRRGSPDDTLKVLDEAREALGDRLELRLARIGHWAGRGGDGAVKALDRLAEGRDALPPDDRDRVDEALAEAYARLGDPRRAGAILEALAGRRPDDLRFAIERLELALRSGDEAAARGSLERLRRLEGEDGAIWRFGRAMLLVRQARRDGRKQELADARLLLVAASQLRPRWSRIPRLEAEIAEIEGDGDRALEAYQRAIERGDRGPDLVQRAVVLLLDRGRGDEADRLVEALLEETVPTGVAGRLAAEMALRHREPEKAFALAVRAVPADAKDGADQLWLGRMALACGHRREAGEALRRAVELARNSPDVWEAYVSYLITAGPKDRPAALKEIKPESAIAEAAKALPADSVARTLARCQALAGHADEARRQYRAALERAPDDPALLLEIAAFDARTGQGADAEGLLRKVLAPGSKADGSQRLRARRLLALHLAARGGYPNIREALAEIGRNLAERGGSVEDRRLQAILLGMQPGGQREAIRVFEELERQEPPSPDEKVLVAQLYLSIGDWPKARGLLIGALASEPENPGYIASLARGLLAHGQADEAESWVARLENLKPDTPQAVEIKARLLAAQGKGPEAAELVRAFTKDKDNQLALFAALLGELKLHDAAEALYRDLVRRSKQPEAALALAEFLALRHRPAEALDLCDRAWATCAPEKVGHVSVKILYANKADEALADRVAARLEEAIRKKPDSVQLLFDAANVNTRRRHYAEAETAYKRISELDKDHRGDLLNNLAWLLAVEGKGDEALSTINRAIEVAGPQPNLLDTRALAYLAAGQSSAAIDDLEQAVASGAKPELYLHLARARLMAKDRKGAHEAIGKAKAIGLDEEALHPVDREAYAKLLADLARK